MLRHHQKSQTRNEQGNSRFNNLHLRYSLTFKLFSVKNNEGFEIQKRFKTDLSFTFSAEKLVRKFECNIIFGWYKIRFPLIC